MCGGEGSVPWAHFVTFYLLEYNKSIVGKTRKTHLCFLSLFTRLHFMPELSTLSAALCGHINLFNHDMTATKLEVSFEIYAFTLFIKLCT